MRAHLSKRPRPAWIAVGATLVGIASLAFAATRLGQPVRGFPSPGDYPEGLAWDGAHLWSNNYSNGTLYEVDPASGTMLRAFSGGGLPVNPEGLAWDGTYLWTCEWSTGRIMKLRPTPSGIEIVATWPPPPGAGGTVGLEWDGSSLWLATWSATIDGTSQLFQLDPGSLAVVRRFDLPVHFVEDLAWDGHHLWSADWIFGIGFAIDTATGDTLHTYRTPGPHPVGMAWDGEHLWVSDTEKDSLWALDISAGRPTPVQGVSWSALKRVFRPSR